MDISRRASARKFNEYFKETITTVEQYEAKIQELINNGDNNNKSYALLYIAKDYTVSKNILKKLLSDLKENGVFSEDVYFYLVDRQNLSKVIDTNEFKAWFNYMKNINAISTTSSFISAFFDRQKVRLNVFKQILNDSPFMEFMLERQRVFDLIFITIQKNNIPLAEVDKLIEVIENKYPEYISFYLKNYGYGYLGRTLNKVYELTPEYVETHREYFTRSTIRASGFDAKLFFKIGFNWDIFYNIFGYNPKDIESYYFQEWLKGNKSPLNITQAKQVKRVLMMFVDSGNVNDYFSLFEGITNEANAGLEIDRELIKKCLRNTSAEYILFNADVNSKIPKDLLEEYIYDFNHTQISNSVYIGDTLCDISVVQKIIQEKAEAHPRGKEGFHLSDLIFHVSYHTLKKWKEENLLFFESIIKNVEPQSLTYSVIDEDFVDFFVTYFKDKISKINWRKWANIFVKNDVKSDTLLKVFLINQDGSYRMPAGNNEIYGLRTMIANTNAEIDYELIKCYLPYINIMTDIRVPLDIEKFVG